MPTDIQVRKLPKDPGPAGWNCLVSNKQHFPALSQDIEADWVIVGAGFTGIAAAQRLSQLRPQERIVVLDAGQLAAGPAGRNSGFMIDLPHDLNSETYAGSKETDQVQIQLNRHAIEFAKAMAKEYQMPQWVFDPCGKVTGASTDKGARHLQDYGHHLSVLGEQYTPLDASAMQDITGLEYYQAGLFTPHAVMIQPASFIHMAASGLSRKLEIYENTPVTAITLGVQHILTTPKANIKSRHIILAVNGHIQSFGFYPKQLLHVFTYASMTRALTANESRQLKGRPQWGVLPADPMGTTVRRVSDFHGSGDRITVRNRFTLNQSLEVSDDSMAALLHSHDSAFNNRFPMLAKVPMEFRWGGRLCLSWNSVPAFGEVEERIFSACCQNGLGTVKGTLSGMLAVELAVKQDSIELQHFMSQAIPKTLPPQPFLQVGAMANIRWKEWTAGKEL